VTPRLREPTIKLLVPNLLIRKGGETNESTTFYCKGFLQVGGAVLVIIGLLGMLGILIGPTPDNSLFKETWWFDQYENVAHLVLGIAGLAAAYLFPPMYQRYLVMLLGVLGVAAGLYSLIGPVTQGANLLGAQFQNPADTSLHLVVGAWQFTQFLGKKAAA